MVVLHRNSGIDPKQLLCELKEQVDKELEDLAADLKQSSDHFVELKRAQTDLTRYIRKLSQ